MEHDASALLQYTDIDSRTLPKLAIAFHYNYQRLPINTGLLNYETIAGKLFLSPRHSSTRYLRQRKNGAKPLIYDCVFSSATV